MTLSAHFLTDFRFEQMAEFMNHYTIHNFWWHYNKQTVEIQIPVPSTASPSGRLKSDCNTTISHANLICLVLDPLRNYLMSLLFYLFYFICRKKPERLCFRLFPIMFFQMLCNPVLFRKKKLLHRTFAGSIRSFYENTVVCHNTDRNRAASGFLDDVGQLHKNLQSPISIKKESLPFNDGSFIVDFLYDIKC